MRRGDVKQRTDFYYHKPEFEAAAKLLKAGKYPLSSLEGVCNKITDGTHFTPNYVSEGEPFISVKNVREFEISFEDIKYISFEEHEKLSKRCKPEANDILLTKIGTIGLAAVIPSGLPTFDIFVSLCLLKPNHDLIDKNYFAYVLNSPITRKQFFRELKGVGVPDLHLENIGRILIPLPPLPIQEKLVEEMERARESRRRKLLEADALLSTLDGWLLETLGITPPPEDNRKVFAVKLKAINSERIDALYYLPTFIKAAEELKKLSHKVAPLRSQLEFAPLNGLDSRNYVEAGQRYLRVQNVRPYQIDASDAKYVETNTTKDINLQVGDVLLTRKGTYGVAAPVTQKYVNDLISSEVILLRLSEHSDISTDYLVYWLNSSLAQLMFKRLKTGGVMGHITQDVVNDFPVPIVDKNTQKIIVDKFNELREESRRLKSEAESEWQAAKDWFEARLLGE